MVQGNLCDRQMVFYWVLRFSIKNSCTTWMLTQSALVLWMLLFITLLYSLDMAWVQGDSGATRHLPRITLNSRGEGDITGRELKEHGQRSSLHHPGRVLRDLPFPKKWTCEQSTCTMWVLELGGHCKQRSCLPCFTLKRTSSLLCYLTDLTEVVVELTPKSHTTCAHTVNSAIIHLSHRAMPSHGPWIFPCQLSELWPLARQVSFTSKAHPDLSWSLHWSPGISTWWVGFPATVRSPSSLWSTQLPERPCKIWIWS